MLLICHHPTKRRPVAISSSAEEFRAVYDPLRLETEPSRLLVIFPPGRPISKRVVEPPKLI